LRLSSRSSTHLAVRPDPVIETSIEHLYNANGEHFDVFDNSSGIACLDHTLNHPS
jgi:hypothetical protein